MSNKVIILDTVQHRYDLDDCAGCHKPITADYHEIGLPSPDGTKMKHIALCESCYKVAESHGVF